MALTGFNWLVFPERIPKRILTWIEAVIFCFSKDLIRGHETSVNGVGFFSKLPISGQLKYGTNVYEIKWIRPVFFLSCWRGGAQKK
jgi:hypothetical protein